MQVYSRGVKWGITVGHTSTIAKIDEIGNNFNENVLKWKGKLEHHAKLKTNLETIHECLNASEDQANNSPELAISELVHQLRVENQPVWLNQGEQIKTISI